MHVCMHTCLNACMCVCAFGGVEYVVPSCLRCCSAEFCYGDLLRPVSVCCVVLCHDVLQYVVFCCAMNVLQCNVVQCYIMLCYVLCYGLLCSGVPCSVMLCSALPRFHCAMNIMCVLDWYVLIYANVMHPDMLAYLTYISTYIALSGYFLACKGT